MHLNIATLAFVLNAGLAVAMDKPVELVQAKNGGLSSSQTALAGETRRYIFTLQAAGRVEFIIDADNAHCGYDIVSSARNGFLPSLGRFPVRDGVEGIAGEVYRILLFQTRSAWIDKVACKFTLQLR